MRGVCSTLKKFFFYHTRGKRAKVVFLLIVALAALNVVLLKRGKNERKLQFRQTVHGIPDRIEFFEDDVEETVVSVRARAVIHQNDRGKKDIKDGSRDFYHLPGGDFDGFNIHNLTLDNKDIKFHNPPNTPSDVEQEKAFTDDNTKSKTVRNNYFTIEEGEKFDKYRTSKPEDIEEQNLNRPSSPPSPPSALSSTHHQFSQHHCPDLFITQHNKLPYGKCKPHMPSEESCVFAEQLYYLDGNLTRCKKAWKGNICSFKDNSYFLAVECDTDLCTEDADLKPITVMTLDPNFGQQTIHEAFSDITGLQDELPSIIEKAIEDRLTFLFLTCWRKLDQYIVSQLLPIDPKLTIREWSNRTRSFKQNKNALNVNILLLDSVSRAHFYRSLPRTVDLFRQWTNDPRSPAQVFDFELFQAVEGHTAENTHALFTGKFLPPHKEDAILPVEMGVLFGHFAKAGYQTMWQEDLCWKGLWGLMGDLAISEWRELRNALRDNYIDHTGITHSSCEILSEYELESPFNGPDGDQICYNGKFQHSYLLQYTLDMLRAIKSRPKALPLLSYMSLSVGHDHIGRRIQSFDPALVKYMKNLGQDHNTITIMLADHGNTYTEYASTVLEGRFEMFHPSLFIIVPKNVAKLLGDEAITALRTNQRRLITMIDLHHSLMALAGPLKSGRVKPVGVFTPISTERTCDSVELRTPNLCVCEGWDSPTTNDTLKLAIVEFAIGQLNNKIDDQFIKSMGNKKYFSPLLRSCRRLEPVRFEDVRERNSQFGLLITSMNIYVRSGDSNAGNALELFRVEVESTESPNYNSMDMRLLNYDRGTIFGKYRECADYGISLKLCICSWKRPVSDNLWKSLVDVIPLRDYTNFLGAQASFRSIDKRGCLYIIRRNHSNESFAYEIANFCVDVDFVIVWLADVENIKLSRNLPFEMKVFAGAIRFGFAARKDILYWKSELRVTVKLIETIFRKGFSKAFTLSPD